MTRRKLIKSAAVATARVVKPVRRGKVKWLMLPRNLKISRATIAAAIRADRDAR